MSFLTILDTLLLGPLKLVFEIIYVIANRFIGNPGLAIIVLSLIMNVLVLPLYRRADAMQEAARDVEAKLHRGVAHIKKVFTGDERMMILQTYYRQNDYRPTDALNGSVSLLLEIPFFMAAYQFLSQLDLLKGVSFGPIADLSAPDGLLVLGAVTVNLLPILMTAINVVSSMIYLKGFPLKTKIQLYGMAAFFLVFLYNSPSGLVFYWTLNNLFSLGKTIFYKLKHAKTVGAWVLSLSGLAALVFGLFLYHPENLKRKLFVIGIGLLLQLPVLLPRILANIQLPASQAKPNWKLFLWGSLFLTLLVGVLIPSNFIAASPQEFVDINYFHHPLWYVARTACYSAGTFLIWMKVFYWLANEKGKVLFDRIVWVLCGVMLVNYMFFGTDLGVLTTNLQYEDGLSFSLAEQLINLAVITVLAGVLCFAACRWSRQITAFALVLTIAIGGMAVPNLISTHRSVSRLTEQSAASETGSPYFHLSKTGNNVVVIILDRAMAQMVPFIFHEKPELKEQFAGFTFYENTISHGRNTNFTTASIYGGYEYTPVELNRRSSESLKDKQNEALKVLPVLFSQNGYEVTVCDPVYANYLWIPDLSIYDDYPEIRAYNTEGAFLDEMQKQPVIEVNYRNFFCFSFMKTLPLVLQPTLYFNGNYNNSSDLLFYQVQHSMSTAEGYTTSFMNAYNVLDNLPYMTEPSDGDTGTFLFLYNGTPHQIALLQTPDYVPAPVVDNSAYDALHADRFTLDGRTLDVRNVTQMYHYHVNMASFLQVGQWLDYLREQGLYDNTRIILVADHGHPLNLEQNVIIPDDTGKATDISAYHPLLMVKDFGSTEFTTSQEFMTIADVPALATGNLIESPVNPFTGKIISSSEKTAHPQYVIRSTEWNISTNNGNTYLPSKWASVEKDLRDPSNWKFYDETIILTEHHLPQQ